MSRHFKAAMAFAFSLGLGVVLGAASAPSPAHADALLLPPGSPAIPVGAAIQPPHDPNKKSAGDACKTSDECQKHHTCTKVGDKSVCQAPPPARLPPGAVT
jgi:hypothetical protein